MPTELTASLITALPGIRPAPPVGPVTIDSGGDAAPFDALLAQSAQALATGPADDAARQPAAAPGKDLPLPIMADATGVRLRAPVATAQPLAPPGLAWPVSSRILPTDARESGDETPVDHDTPDATSDAAAIASSDTPSPGAPILIVIADTPRAQVRPSIAPAPEGSARAKVASSPSETVPQAAPPASLRPATPTGAETPRSPGQVAQDRPDAVRPRRTTISTAAPAERPAMAPVPDRSAAKLLADPNRTPAFTSPVSPGSTRHPASRPSSGSGTPAPGRGDERRADAVERVQADLHQGLRSAVAGQPTSPDPFAMSDIKRAPIRPGGSTSVGVPSAAPQTAAASATVAPISEPKVPQPLADAPVGAPNSADTTAPLPSADVVAAPAPIPATGSAAPAPETTSATPDVARISRAAEPGPSATAQPLQTPAPQPVTAPPRPESTSGPAFQVFAAERHRGEAEERRPSSDAPAAPAMMAASTAAPVAAASESQRTPLDLRQERWPHAVVERIERMRDEADAASTRITLRPDALGSIDVSVRTQGDQVHVHFTAEQAATRQLLAEAAPRLAEAAEARGLRLGQTSVDAGQTGQGGERRTPPQPSAPLTPAPTRRTESASEPESDTRTA